MKPAFYFTALLILAAACHSNKPITTTDIAELPEDSVSYELLVLDPGFESWYLLHNQPSKYHVQAYYEDWNQRYVDAWNYGRIGYKHTQLIHGYIDYNPSEDYGFEINHKLFYYFMYVERELGIRLLPDGPATY